MTVCYIDCVTFWFLYKGRGVMFGQFLLRQGVISEPQLSEALTAQKDLGKPLGETLVHLGYIEMGVLELHLEQHLLHHAEELINDPDLQAV